MRATLMSGADCLNGQSQCAAETRQTLLRALTELYVQKAHHSAEEERQFVELAIRLLDAVDAVTRAEIARRLADYPGAPADLLGRFTFNSSKDLDEIRRQSPPDLPPDAGISVSSTEPDDIASAVALTQRFFTASPKERAAILAELETEQALEPAALRPSPDIASVLETSALAGRPAELIRTLERALGIARSLADLIVNDHSGESIVVAAKALAIPIDVLQRILLFVNPSVGHSVNRVFALSALFGEIGAAAALRLVAAWRKASGSPSPRRSAAPPPAMRAAGNAFARTARAAPAQGQGEASSANDPFEKVAS